MDIVLRVVCYALFLYYIVLIARIILSFITRPPEPLAPLIRVVLALTDPLLVPLRRVIPPVRLGAGALDLSPLVVFLGVRLLQGLLCRPVGL